MSDDLDDAIETATKRAREAEEALIQQPIESPKTVVDAHVVERRAEDLDALAQDAARGAVSEE